MPEFARTRAKTGKQHKGEHDMRQAVVQACVAVSMAGVLWGCAPLTEQERYERAELLNQAREEYQRREKACENSGGAMQMRAHTLLDPGYLDYRSARCVRR